MPEPTSQPNMLDWLDVTLPESSWEPADPDSDEMCECESCVRNRDIADARRLYGETAPIYLIEEYVAHEAQTRRLARRRAATPQLERRFCERCGNARLVDAFDGASECCNTCTEMLSNLQAQVDRHGRTFGVEIEFSHDSSGEYDEDYDRYSERDPDAIVDAIEAAGVRCTNVGYTHEVMPDSWKIVPDSSLEGGWELVSPPLRWGQRRQVVTVCRVLRELGASATPDCGLHVHHDIRDLDVDGIKKLAANWVDAQHHTDRMVDRSRRDGRSQWCDALSRSELRAIQEMVNVAGLTSGAFYLDRYRTLNLSCYAQYGTVEIRQHEGTLDATRILAWVAYGQAVVEAAAQGTEPPLDNSHGYLDALPFRCDDSRERLKTRITA